MLKTTKDNVFRCIVTGVLLILAWPPISLTPVLLVAFIPLLTIIDKERSLKRVFLYSYLSFFIWTLGTMYWIGNTHIDGQGVIILLAAWLLIPLFQSIPILIFAWIGNNLTQQVFWFFFPLVWVSYEFLHSQWQLSFTWLHLGFGLGSAPWAIQFYEITGYLGGSFMVVLFNVLLLLLLKNYKGPHFRPVLVVTCSLLVLIAVANLALSPNPDSRSKPSARVAIVQSNANSYLPVDKNSLSKQLEEIKTWVEPLKGDSLDLIVFSEGLLRSSPASPFLINNPDNQLVVKEIKKISAAVNAPILIGFIGFKLFTVDEAPARALPTGDGRFFSGFNGAMLIAADQPTQIQIKNNLVPFMERVPYVEKISFLDEFKLGLNQMKSSYEKDGKINVFHYKDLRIAPLICLDALFPAYAAQFINSHANLIAIIANDSWAGQTSGYLQNASYASVAAISFRREVVRCASTGRSMFVNSRGSASNITSWNAAKTIIKKVNLENIRTLNIYSTNVMGIFSLSCTLVIVIGFIISRVAINKFSSE